MDHQTEALPDDALADILRRLEPCDLAASRCVRKAWRAVVDARRLLLPHLLPRALHGIFINYVDYKRPHCFSRPSSSAKKPVISGNLSFLPGYTQDYNPIIDHCNGLVLYEDFPRHYVVNPATGRWDRFRSKRDLNRHAYLAFDPAVSPHYQVFFVPDVPKKVVTPPVPREQQDPHDTMEWPPSSWILSVFSSCPRKWQKRSFLREGQAVGTVTSVREDPLWPKSICCNGPRRRYGVYWSGSLYVHCRGAFVARFSLLDSKYQIIKLPKYTGESKHAQYLGKSVNGVCLAIIHDGYRLRVCNLVESDGHIDWVLTHYVGLEPWTSVYLDDLEGFDKTWTLDDADDDNNDYDYDYDDDDNDYDYDDDDHDHDSDGYDDGDGDANGDGGIDDDEEEGKEEEEGEENDGMQMWKNLEWNSDDDNVLDIEDGYTVCRGNVYFLGFHPYKEVIFLGLPGFQGVAYHLESSKIQYLGKLRPKHYSGAHTNGMFEAYMYTPCMIGELRKQASDSHRRG